MAAYGEIPMAAVTRPFVWTKTAEQILESIARYCERINQSRH